MKNFITALLVLSTCLVIGQNNCTTAVSLGTLGAPGNCGTGIKYGTAVNQAGTTVGVTGSNPYTSLSGCNMASPAVDVWYLFVAPTNGYGVVITVSGGTLANPNIALWNGTTCGSLTGVNCIVGAANTATLNVGSGLVPGQTYYIQISGNTGETGTFTLNVKAYQDCADCLNSASLTATPLPVNGTYQPGQTVNFCFHIDQWTQTNNNWLHGVQMAFGPGWNLASLTTTAPPPYLETSANWGGTIPTCGNWTYYPAGTTSSATGVAWPAGFYFNGVYTQNAITGIPNGCTSDADGNPGNNFGDGIANPGLVVTPPANQWDFCWTITVSPGCNPGASLSVKVTTSGDGESGSWSNTGCANDPATNFLAMVSCCPPNMASTPTCTGTSAGSVTATPVGNAGPYTYTWSSNSQNAGQISNLPSGSYTVTVVDANLCSATASATVTAEPLPTSNAGAAVSFCSGGNASIGAASTAGNTYSWSPTTGLSSPTAANPTVTLTNVTANPVTTAYTVTTTITATGCTSTATVNVTVNPAPVPTATNTGPYCVQSTVQLNGGGGGTYAWSGPNGFASAQQNPSIANSTLAMAGNYTVTVTGAGNCTATATTSVTITSNLSPVATNTGPYCAGDPVALNVAGGTNYTWSGPNAFTSASQNPTFPAATAALAGAYNVTATDNNGCSGTATTTVVVNPLPVPTATNTGPYCVTTTISLNAVGGANYSWSGPNAFTSASQSPTIANATVAMSGAYNVTVTDNHSCTATATTNVTVNPAPVVTAGPDGVITCANPQTTLNAAAIPVGDTYNWGGPGVVSGGTTATPTVNAAGAYTLTVTDVNNCTATGTANITSTITPPNTNIGAGGTLTCVVNSVTLTISSSTPNATFVWSNGPITGTNPVTTAGTYTVTVTDPVNGCTASASDVVALNTTAPNVNAGPDEVIPCSSPTVVLSGSSTTANATFSWSGGTIASGATTAAPNVSATGPYTLTVTDPANGCTASATTNVTAAVPPVVTATITNNPCAQLSVGAVNVVVAGGQTPYAFNWSNGALTQSLNGLRGGSYALTVSDAYGCTVNNTYIVTEGAFSVQALQDATINLGQSVQLGGVVTGGSNNVTYLWTSDFNLSCLTCLSPVAAPYQTIIYSLQASDTNGCIASDTIQVIVIPSHHIFIPNAFSPNGDGNNDFFSINGDLELMIYFEVKIFDRWGEKVFESNSQHFKWDGTFRGVLETPQVFVYEIKATFLDRYTSQLYKGSVTLLR